jgi:AhpD family alkylhydroperoxidase
MARTEGEADITETLGMVPEFIGAVPDYLLDTEWASYKKLMLSETAIPNKYKELIGLGVSGATRCKYCAYYHSEAARLFGASEDEINEAALVAKNTMGWSTYLNALQFDYDRFKNEFDQMAEYVRTQMGAAV